MTANDHEEAPVEPEPIDYEALVRARVTLKAESERRYYEQASDPLAAMYNGVVYQQLQVAEYAIFQALNVLSNFGKDPEARRLAHVTEWPPPEAGRLVPVDEWPPPTEGE